MLKAPKGRRGINRCPECGGIGTSEKVATWKIVLAFTLGPIGCIFLFFGSKKKTCINCGHVWK